MSDHYSGVILYCEQKGTSVKVTDTNKRSVLNITGEFISHTSNTVTIRSWGSDHCDIVDLKGKFVGHLTIPRPPKETSKSKSSSNNYYSSKLHTYEDNVDDEDNNNHYVKNNNDPVYHLDSNMIVHQGRVYDSNDYEFVYTPEFRDYVLVKKREMTGFGKFYNQFNQDGKFWITWALALSAILIIAAIVEYFK